MRDLIIGQPIDEALLRKLRAIRDLIDAGRLAPDPLKIAWVVGVLTDCGERALARDYERIARRLMPSFPRDLT